jgi:lipopolysaccharide biosynthesis glycosyltransferase
MARQTIAVACSIDDRYALPLAVMLESLAACLPPQWQTRMYLLHRNLSQAACVAIDSLVDLHLIPLAGPCLDKLPRDHRYPPEAAAPLFLPELLPADIGRVLFLDADMLVLDDIGPLWSHDLAGRSWAAAVDSAIPLCRAPRGVPRSVARGIPADASYCNAGVMLIDVEAWRQRGVAERALDSLGRIADRNDFLHQEALNATAWNDWSPLDPRWNLPATVGRWFDRTPTAAAAAPGIVHFAGRAKPWRMRIAGRFADPYARVLMRVVDRLPAQHHTMRDSLVSLYDRMLRDWCYPCERFMWERRLL